MNGPKVLFEIPLFGGIKVTESIVNMWIIMAVLVIVSVWPVSYTHLVYCKNEKSLDSCNKADDSYNTGV